MNPSIGEIFELSQRLQGKNTAYKWALRDVKFNQLWSAYGGRDATGKLKKYARIYKKKWQDFLQSTLAHEGKSTRLNLWNLAPTDDLVAFLIEAEQFDEAVAVTEAMLIGFEAGVQHLNLPSEYLPLKAEDQTNVSGRMLLSYFFVPDKVARLKAAKEISNLLLDEGNFRNLYLEKLGTLLYEADICDFLSVLKLSDPVPFSESEIRSVLRHPSVLSEYILETLGFSPQFENLEYSEFSNGDLRPSERMERSKNGVPNIWSMQIHRLSRACGLRLDLRIAAEWEELTKRKPFLFFNHTDYISEKYHSLDNVSCSLSWNCESAIVSAYLRTIGYCFVKGILDSANLAEYIVPALPFGEPLSDISPSQRPDFWPDFGNLNMSGSELSDAVLQHFLNEWKLPSEVPLFASGPLRSDERGIDIDWECMVVSEEDHQGQLTELFGHIYSCA
ncbi:hypothetical protein [Octadecabacter arcticus]|uniref:hypothetical protein n=1 Tax=Octadecabacter arcticus TaxID=53946 RepID=UPI0001809D9A|nr:hypothetical protein [Octadecabacter arcticus]